MGTKQTEPSVRPSPERIVVHKVRCSRARMSRGGTTATAGGSACQVGSASEEGGMAQKPPWTPRSGPLVRDGQLPTTGGLGPSLKPEACPHPPSGNARKSQTALSHVSLLRPENTLHALCGQKSDEEIFVSWGMGRGKQ